METETANLSRYTVVMSEKNNKIFLLVKELGILVSGNSAQEAFDNLVLKRTSLAAELVEAGLYDSLPSPRLRDGRIQSRGESYSRHAVKGLISGTMALVVLGIVMLGGGLVLNHAANRMETKIDLAVKDVRTSIKRVNRFNWEKIEKEILRAAEPRHDLDPEKVEKIRSSLRILVDRVQPFTNEIFRLFDDNEARPVR